jgi:hypothetical protein
VLFFKILRKFVSALAFEKITAANYIHGQLNRLSPYIYILIEFRSTQ